MYTLEDDHETSSRFKKRDFVEEEAGTFGDPTLADNSPVEIPQQPTQIQTPEPEPKPTRKLPEALAPTPDPKARRMALLALTVACIGVFFTSLDQTVVVTALPQIITTLHIPITQLDHAAWIVSAYLLGFVVAMPLMGRVSDMYGRRRIFLLCMLIFGLGSIFCGLAPLLGELFDLKFLAGLGVDVSSPGLVWLITARLIQAVGGGAIVPIAMALASDFYGKERRGLALGMIGAMTEAGGALGPLYGAIIVGRLGWEYIFYLNVPLVIALLVAAWFFIPRGKRLKERIDWIGALLLGIALTCLSLGLAQQGTTLSAGSASGSTPQNNPIALVLAVLFLVGFILYERRQRWPVVDLSLFKRLTFSASALVSLFVGAALIIAMADIPIYVDTVIQGNVLDSGLALLRMTAMIPVGAILGGWLCSRITCRLTGIIGLLFTAVGFFLMSRWPIHVDWLQMTISTLTAGFGFGLVISPISTTAINAVSGKQAGLSSSIVTALRMIGMILGLAALTSWALAYFRELARNYQTLPAKATGAEFTAWSKGYAQHLIESAHTVYCSVFFTSMVLCLIALIPALFLWGRQMPVAETEVEEPEELEPDIAEMPTNIIANPAAKSRQKRKRLIVAGSIGLVLLLIGGGILTAFMLAPEDDEEVDNGPVVAATTPGSLITDNKKPTNSGPRQIQLALDGSALTSIFVQQLNLQPDVMSNLVVTPQPNDGLVLTLTLHINANGIQRDMPIELDGKISVDKQQNLQLQVDQLKRDGIPADSAAAASMQTAINQLFADAVMPALHGQLKGVKLLSVHTDSGLSCSKGETMLVLQVEAPPIQGVEAGKPLSFCLTGPVDLKNLLPK